MHRVCVSENLLELFLRLYAHPGCQGPIMSWLRCGAVRITRNMEKPLRKTVTMGGIQSLNDRFIGFPWLSMAFLPIDAIEDPLSPSESPFSFCTAITVQRNEVTFGWPMFPLRSAVSTWAVKRLDGNRWRLCCWDSFQENLHENPMETGKNPWFPLVSILHRIYIYIYMILHRLHYRGVLTIVKNIS